MNNNKKEEHFSWDYAQENEAFRNAVATMEKNGTRKWVYAKKPAGKYTNYRSIVSILLLALLFILPFITLPNGNPIFKFDVFNTQFVLFGYPFFTTDFFLLAFGMIICVVFVILFTTVYGRIFCGWFCPQTIFLEFIFRKIEYLIEGDRNKQIRLDKQEWDEEKIMKKGAKWFIYYLISFVVINILMAYIVGMDFLKSMYTDSPSDHIGKFIGMFIISWLFFFVFAWFREQACTLVCPYGRLQGVLIDKNSMQVSYDFKRGEGRSKFRKNEDRKAAGKGDCIDCGQCVAVCPTGIDIRNGSQLECVNCTACMDACDEVMDKINLPKGLIRFASEENISEGTPFRVSFRMVSFSVILIAMIAGLSVFVMNRSDVEAKFLQIPGSDYREEGVFIVNTLQYSLMNKTNQPHKLKAVILSHPKSEIELISDRNKTIDIDAGELKQGFIKVKIPRAELESYKELIRIELIDEKNNPIDQYEISFMAPFDIGIQ